MTLSEYLSRQKMTVAAFSALIGVTPTSAARYAKCERIPRPQIMARIEKITAGKVCPTDFYAHINAPAPERAA